LPLNFSTSGDDTPTNQEFFSDSSVLGVIDCFCGHCVSLSGVG